MLHPNLGKNKRSKLEAQFLASNKYKVFVISSKINI